MPLVAPEISTTFCDANTPHVNHKKVKNNLKNCIWPLQFMVKTAAHLIDRILPRLPFRQFVISFPTNTSRPQKSRHSSSRAQYGKAREKCANYWEQIVALDNRVLLKP